MKKLIALILAAVLALSLTAVFADTINISIPDDGTNLARGIKLLETAGLIKVDPAAGFTPEMADIEEYLYDIKIVPLEANILPASLDEFGASTINGTYAIPNGLIPSRDGLIIEQQSEDGDNPYVNIIAARAEDADNEIYKTIVAAHQTQEVAEFLLVYYNEAYFPAFEYDANITLTKEEADALSQYESDPEGKTLVKVGVCGANNDHWKVVQKVLDEQGANIYIELVVFDAYNLPNAALNLGDIDLNAFQHKAYMNKDADANGYSVVSIGDTLIAPLTLYSKNFDSLEALKEAAGEL